MATIKICLVGHYPPPFGGESVEVQAIAGALRSRGVECRVLNLGENRTQKLEGCLPVQSVVDYIRKTFCARRQGYLLHLITNGHNLKSWLSALPVVGGTGKGRSVLTLGSGDMPSYVKTLRGISRMTVGHVLAAEGSVIVRNEQAMQALRGMTKSFPHVRIVPPYVGEIRPRPELLPEEVSAFLSSRQPTVLSAVAYRPEYGIDLALEAVGRLRTKWPRIGLVLLGTRTGEETVKEAIREKGLEDVVLLAGGLSHEAYLGALERATLFLRGTLFDGDASSVREAVALGKPTIASRTAFRPEGTTLFEPGNLEDLIRVLERVLQNPAGFLPSEEKRESVIGRLEKVTAVYRDILIRTGFPADHLPEWF